MDVNDLFSKLLSTGILQKVGSPTEDVKPITATGGDPAASANTAPDSEQTKADANPIVIKPEAKSDATQENNEEKAKVGQLFIVIVIFLAKFINENVFCLLF